MIEGLRSQFSCAASSVLGDAEMGSKNMLSSIDRMNLDFIQKITLLKTMYNDYKGLTLLGF